MDTPAATDSLTAALEELRHRFGERLLTFLQFFTGAGFGDHYRAVDICQPGADIVDEVAQVESLLGILCAP